MKRTLEAHTSSLRRKRKKSHGLSSATEHNDDHEVSTKDPPPLESLLPLRSAREIYANITKPDLRGCLRVTVVMRWKHPDHLLVHAEITEDNGLFRFDINLTGACFAYFTSNNISIDPKDKLYVALKGVKLERTSRPTSTNFKWTVLPMALTYDEGLLLQFLEKHHPGPVGIVIDTWTPTQTKVDAEDRSHPSQQVPCDLTSPPLASGSEKVVPIDSAPSPHSLPKNHVSTSASVVMGLQEDEAQGQHVLESDVAVAPASELASAAEHTSDTTSSAQNSCLAPTAPGHEGDSSSRVTPVVPIAPVRPLYRESRNPGRGRQPRRENKLAESSKPKAPLIQDTVQPQAQNGTSLGAKCNGQKKQKRNKKNPMPAHSDGTPVDSVASADAPGQASSRNSTPNEADTRAAPRMVEATPKEAEAMGIGHPQPGTVAISKIPPSSASEDGGLVKCPAASLAQPASPPADMDQASDQAKSAGKSATPPSDSDHNPALDLQSGCYPEDSMVEYPPLRDLTPGRRLNIIGVVLSSQTKTTSREQWMNRMVLVDPSIYDRNMPQSGLGVNCFTDRDTDNVHNVHKGDILLLRVVQIQEQYSVKMGVCGNLMAWTWAMFSPETGTVTSGGESSRMTFKPSQAELSYCIKLGDWWRAVQEREEISTKQSNVTVHDLADIYPPPRVERIHRLIQDASPTAPPNGYFDCTVEVLKTHRNDNGVWSVYVTDYTSNEGLADLNVSWSDSSLVNRILKVEMWDAAGDVAANMQPGEFYSIRNMRMKLSNGGYWEGKAVQGHKIRRLDDDELESEPNLRDLLGRKKEWEDMVVERGDVELFSHKLFKEAELDEHFNCTARVLHVSLKENGRAFIYVTDYTPRKDLAAIPATARWTGNLSDDRILKIALSDTPAETAKTLSGSDYIAMRRLRLKSFKSGGIDVSGRLGGDEQMVFKLNPADTGNSNFVALLRREKEWEKTVNSGLRHQTIASSSKIRRPKVAATEVPKYEELEAFTIEEIQAYEGPPALFEPVVARIVDFWPENLADCVILRCTQCNEDLPETLQICTKCDDSMDTHVRPVYRFSFEIEDEHGDRLQVAASHPDCSILKDLPLADLHEDDEALEAFTERLQPLLGKLITEHSRLIEDAAEGQVQPDWEPHLLRMSIAGMPNTSSENPKRFYLLNIDPTPVP
ncbi:hypothetical protein NM688_g2350 [Phlebia brevispora]|uniref:Uncharacterized protein n=1 Tax=Phlebia brevispora TaxID=194682 RepID=A0ACC1T8U8_9APHY|nr:hypothetical protein NM688_g2350 [Phlebia brevispora]